MKRWYSVMSSIYDDRTNLCMMGVKESKERPERVYRHTNRCDIYIDWFDSREKAINFVNEQSNVPKNDLNSHLII